MLNSSPPLSKRLDYFADATRNASLRGILRGLEKESLRITPMGTMAQTDHPASLGAALTHPHITTDYSEALLEFITQPFAGVTPLLQQLEDIHRFTYQQLNASGERLWPASMPCSIGRDEDIPVGRYGSSNSGTMKTVYRLGLGHRYGRAMQTIAGIHYNFSLPDDFWLALQVQEGNKQPLKDFKTERYFGLIRNFRRNFWLLIYLFGASPALCSCFVQNRPHQLQAFAQTDHSLYLPNATSLRMGDLGYQSDAQRALVVNYNNLGDYLKTLCGAITQSHGAYERLGLKDVEGNYQQLNTSLLQIENEFYSSIRPKRTSGRGETALQALQLRGVEYVEVRCIDLNPYEPLGINAEQIRLMDAFLLHCLLSPSPMTNEREFCQAQENQTRVVNNGRAMGVELLRGDGAINMREWAKELLDGSLACAALLDQANGSSDYHAAVQAQFAKVENPELTPSARILRDMNERQCSFSDLVLGLAQKHSDNFNAPPVDDAQRAYFEQLNAQFHTLSAKSHASQAELEAEDTGSFADYLANYYAQYRGCSSCG